MIIDAKNAVVGRVATVAAKQALLGEQVIVVNCKDAVVSGKKQFLFKAQERKQSMGQMRKGPFHPRTSERFVKRIIRGMLPHHQPRGYEVLHRIKCYSTVPESLQGKETVTLSGADASKLTKVGYIKVQDIIKHVGGKI